MSVSRLSFIAVTSLWMPLISQTSTWQKTTCWGNVSGGGKLCFFHLIDNAAVNGFILFDQLRKADPTSLLRNKKYSVLEFREEVIRNLAGINEYASPPVFKPFVHQNTYHSDHVPHFGDKRNNCKVCYQTLKKECKVSSFCPAPQCQVFLHCSVGKNCFAVWHDKTFH